MTYEEYRKKNYPLADSAGENKADGNTQDKAQALADLRAKYVIPALSTASSASQPGEIKTRTEKVVDRMESKLRPTASPVLQTEPVISPLKSVETGGKYYSKPENLWSGAALMEQRITQTEGNLKVLQRQAQYMADAWQKSQSDTAFQMWQDVYNRYEAEYDAYTKYYDEYDAYRTEQQRLYDDWRGTVRSEGDVQLEISALQEQIEAAQADRKAVKERADLLSLKVDNRSYVGETRDALRAEFAQVQEELAAADERLSQLYNRQDLLKEEYDWARRLSYEDMRASADFAQKSKADVKKYGDDILYKVVNRAVEPTKASGGNILQRNTAYIDVDNKNYLAYDSDKPYEYMTEDEIAMYNYLYAAKGKQYAEEYLNDLVYGTDEIVPLAQRSAKDIAAEHDSKVGKVLYGAVHGLDENRRGIMQMFSEEPLPPSASGYAVQEMKEDLGAVGSTLQDLAVVAGNMAPSILLSMAVGNIAGAAGATAKTVHMLGAIAGNAFTGTTTAGNAYGEKVREGYSKDAAKSYAALVAASEVGLGSLLGGFSKLGGTASIAKVAEKLASIDNAFLRFAVKTGTAMISEGTEEGLQTVLEPMFASLVFDEELEPAEVGEVAYSFLLGALSAGVMETPNIATEETVNALISKAKKDAMKDKPSADAPIRTEKWFEPEVSEDGTYEDQDGNRVLTDGTKIEKDGTKVLSTADTKEQGKRMERAKTVTARTGVATGATDGQVKTAERLSKILGKEIRFFRQDAAADGSIENGLYRAENDVILVNAASEKGVRWVVAHELTHSTELSSEYKTLNDFVISQMQEMGVDVEAMVKQRQTLYAEHGVTLTDPDAKLEVVADFAADYLLTDEKTIRALVKGHPTVAQRILEWVDGIRAKNGNEDAELRVMLQKARDMYAGALSDANKVREGKSEKEPVKKLAEDTAQDLAKGKDVDYDALDEERSRVGESMLEDDGRYAEDGGVIDEEAFAGQVREHFQDAQWSIEKLPNGKKYVRADRQVIFGNDPYSWSEQLEDYINGKIRRGEDVHLIAEDGDVLTLTADTAGKISSMHDGDGKTLSNAEFERKVNAGTHIDELVQVSKRGRTKPDYDGRHGAFASRGWNYRIAYFQDFDGKYYRVKLSVAMGEDGDVVYNVGEMEERSFPTVNGSSVKDGALSRKTSSSNSISQTSPAVKEKLSVTRSVEEQDAIMAQMRYILQNGGTASDLRQYVDTLDAQERAKAKKKPQRANTQRRGDAASQIVRAAHNADMTVEEYLRENAELYETEDGWTREARRALEMERGERYSITTDRVNVGVDTESKTAYVQHSITSWNRSDYVQDRQEAAREISAALGVSYRKALRYIDDINGIAKMIADDKQRLDYISALGGSSFVSNVEYGGSIDFSTLCPKRRLISGTHAAIQRLLGNRVMTAEDVLRMRSMMMDAGYEVACGPCYVEGSRANMGGFMLKFIEMYEAYNPDAEWIPQLYDLVTPEGVEWMRLHHPDVYEQYEQFWNNHGKLRESDPALFASQQKPKLFQARTEYDGEILDKFKKDGQVDAKNRNGGVRLQSFSDFEIVHLIDCMQVIMDMARVGLAGQAYTKVPDFAWALGDTGLKINLSVIAKEVGEDGRLVMNDVDGMPMEDAVKLRERYSENVGIICLVYNDEQLHAAMADERIDFIIPFHRSQWKKSQYKAMGLPEKVKDYTYQQNEKLIVPTYHEFRGKMVKDKAKNYMPNEYWDPKKSGKENAEDYLKMCAANNKRPKFYKLLDHNADGSYSLKADGSTDGYWKLLVDFKMYDNNGKFAPQNPVQPKFNMKEAQRMLTEYAGDHAKLPVAEDIVKEFVADYEKRHAGAKGGQFSISAPEETFKKSKTKTDTAVQKTKNALMARIGDLFSIPSFLQDELIRGRIETMVDEYMKAGKIAEVTVDSIFKEVRKDAVETNTQFYNEQKDTAMYIRNTGVLVDEDVQEKIENWDLFKKQAADIMRISQNDGVTVREMYSRLGEMESTAFPEGIRDTAKQLKRIYEFARSVEKARASMVSDLPANRKTSSQWEKHDFEVAVNEAASQLRLVRRYLEDKQTEEQNIPKNVEEVFALYADLKEARKAKDKAERMNLLTKHDEMQVGRLLRGEIEPEMLDPAKDNVDGIIAVYEAKNDYEKIVAPLRAWNKNRKAEQRAAADELLETANYWNDKKTGLQYSRETMERNIRDIVRDAKGDKDAAIAEALISEYLEPVHKSAAAANRTKAKYRDRVRALKISRKVAKGNLVSEAHAIQLLGEAEDNIDMLERTRGRMKVRDGKTLEEWRGIVSKLWQENPNLDEQKIRRCVQEFRDIYDELFKKMNEVRVRNGYEPINYRHGYFPHFQAGEGDGILMQFGRLLGISMDVTALPTSINGLTHTFRPGIQWFGNAQSRLGFNTAYDAIEGFDKYIEGVADVIHQTDNIQKLRALADQIRYRTTDAGIREQIDAVRLNENLSEEDKQNRLDKIHEKGRYTLSNFVVELEEYTNLLANKKSRADRNMEQAIGRRMYNVAKAVESRVAANMVAINPASWITNLIPLVQGGATLDSRVLLHGMWDTLRAYKTDDGIVDMSSFLTNRRGNDPLVKTWAQSASAVMSKPMELIDQFVADSLVRARYLQNTKKGLSQDAAISEADSWVAGVMADRSKGSTPTLFQRSNPITKLFTQFQLEVNNQLSYLFKDMPRDVKDKGAGALVIALLKFFLGSWLFNELYEFFIGRRPALDPIGILNDTVGDFSGYELPNIVELGVGVITGDVPSFAVDKKNGYEAVSNLFTTTAENLPFVGGILGGGRVPISSALPDPGNLANAIFNSEWDAKKRWATLGKELSNPLVYGVLPFGGGQLKKIFQGIKAVAEGGSYTLDAQGEKKLQYPVYRDTPGEAITSSIGAVLFGKSSLPTGRDWVESGFKTLSAII